ncbi:MAG: metallophosphoesterase [Armatimonadetes bacterium]|nr:metallophosphoesterase [Armatimonadota bacterium]
MTYGIISDIHGNLTALDAVLDRLSGVDRFICPGDIVGYGPDPSECLSRLRSLDCISVLGNHDAAVSGTMDPAWFNPDARAAVLWTRQVLSEIDARSLSLLPMKYEEDGFVVVHSSLWRPEEFHYVISPEDAKLCFGEMTHLQHLQAFPAREKECETTETLPEKVEARYYPTYCQESAAGGSICFIGHSHVSEVYVQHPPYPSSAKARQESFGQLSAMGGGVDQIRMPEGGRLDLNPGLRYIVNCGSVGQPRDGNPEASCAIFDSKKMTIEIIRVPYDVRTVQERMRRAGLPETLIDRLGYGV